MIRKLGAVVVAVLIATTLVGCGGGGGGRPSTATITSKIEDSSSALGSELNTGSTKISSKMATCIAKVPHDSNLSDGALRALVKGDKGYKASSQDEKAIKTLTPKFADCVS